MNAYSGPATVPSAKSYEDTRDYPISQVSKLKDRGKAHHGTGQRRHLNASCPSSESALAHRTIPPLDNQQKSLKCTPEIGLDEFSHYKVCFSFSYQT